MRRWNILRGTHYVPRSTERILKIECPTKQALARLGATTLAIDAASANIAVAQTHAALDRSFPPQLFPAALKTDSNADATATLLDETKMTDLQYRHCAAEDLVKEGKQFDVVCAMEVIEHVEDATGFLDCLSDLTKVRRFVSFTDSFLPGCSTHS
jgi:2-polyprenyl-3-methyl-5-hydroxy-6-metoxy-1,4-benzoquinol methylase